MVIKSFSVVAAGASSSPGPPPSLPSAWPLPARDAFHSTSSLAPVSRSPSASSLADDSRWPLLCHSAQMASAHHGVEHLVCGRTTEKWFQLLIASSTLFVDARRSRKTPRPEKITKVARNCTEKYSVDWRPKSAFEMMYFFYQARPNHAPKILGVQGVTRPKHVKLHAPGVQFRAPRACCTTLVWSEERFPFSQTRICKDFAWDGL